MTRLYAISDRKETAEITCPKHLREALDTHVTMDGYILDVELLRPTDPAHCDRCNPAPEPTPVSERRDEELLDMISAAINGDPTNFREAEQELMQRYPEMKKTMDHYQAHGRSSGIRYGEALMIAALQAKGNK